MDILLIQQIKLKGTDKGFKQIRKLFSSTVVPREGEYIKDGLWDSLEEYKVKKVIFDFENDKVNVWLEDAKIKEGETIEAYVKKARNHNWENNYLFIQNF